GLFCLGYGIYTLVIAYQNWQALKNNKPSSAQRPTLAGILCLSLPACFLWQFLGVDMGSVNVLAQHQVQALLTQNNFGYNVPAALFPLDLSSWDVSTFAGRFVLLADNAGVGLFLPLLYGLMLLSSRQLFKQPLVKTIRPGEKQKLFIRRLLAIGTFGMLAVALVCGLGALACEYQAKTFLATGDYTTSLSWLDTVRILNPSFDQVPFYHIERGQAWYFLHNRQLNDETSIYLAHNYRLQRYYADAYQQLILVW